MSGEGQGNENNRMDHHCSIGTISSGFCGFGMFKLRLGSDVDLSRWFGALNRNLLPYLFQYGL